MVRLKKALREEVFHTSPEKKPPRHDLRKLRLRDDKDSKELREEDEDLKEEK
jgi:hypothetical protein